MTVYVLNNAYFQKRVPNRCLAKFPAYSHVAVSIILQFQPPQKRRASFQKGQTPSLSY